ncbi:claudin-4-like [Poecilia latipinna]|uniref:claudin-4-like n=1 Tax=Poecilia latipinna TaxID=48699 RepID=UPI00072DF8F8|nr:PREDICTED: claudin-4-like [Poecilia latipinna]
MASAGLQILGIALAIIGWIGAIVCCVLPQWKVTAFIGANIVTSQTNWEGIWMTCVHQSTGQMQCKVYDSMLALSSDLQAARALTIISILVGILALLLAIAGGKCTNCIEDERAKTKVCITAGVMFIISGLLCIIPVSWTASTIIKEFYNPYVNSSQKREIGASIYIGWCSTVLLLIGGIILTTSCPPNKPYYPAYRAPMYTYGRPNTAAYGPVYAAPSNQPYTGTYTGSYVPAKPYAAPSAYSAQPYVRN